MPAPMVRDFSTQKFEVAGVAPASATTLQYRNKVITTALVVQILFSNIDTVDRQVVLKDSSDNVMFNNTISAGNLYVVELPQGWKFNGGIKINAAAANAIRYELLGYQLPA